MSSMQPITGRSRSGRRSRRRGTVLILALGVLAVLSIAALSYVTIVRLDRANVTATQQRQNYSAQANLMIEHVQAMLAADIFNNQNVTPAIRERGSAAFSNGEYTDHPSVDTTTFNDKANPLAPASQDTPNSFLNSFEPAPADDAWLASIEPKWGAIVNNTLTVPQLTNLRSMYTWSNVANRWTRSDGRFADLGSWLRASRNGHGDPSVHLLDWTDPRVVRLGPDTAVNVDIFDRQANNMSDFSTVGGSLANARLGPVKPSDERQVIDTDGDLRPDARWTVLDAFGNVGGLKWVVAAKIVDLSALININASIEFGPIANYNDSTELGDGRTPADVDLTGLFKDLERPSPDMPYLLHTVMTDRVFADMISFQRHLEDGLGLDTLFNQIIAEGGQPATFMLAPWTDTNPTDPLQRRVFWKEFGSNSLEQLPLSRFAKGYSLRELVDLNAFYATNHTSFVSRLEQHIDGTEDPLSGYLPNNIELIYGPLRSKETSAARQLRQMPVDIGLPTPEQIKDSVRRFGTSASGAGQFSPVPVLDDGNTSTPFLGPYRNNKIRVDRPLGTSEVRDAFQSFVWALAPLATNRPLTSELAQGSASTTYEVPSEDAHYGGSVADAGPPYRALARHLAPLSAVGAPLASYAAVTAASMAVNLADATDEEYVPEAPVPPLRTTMASPTIAAIYNTTGSFTQTQDLVAMGAIPLTPQLSQGVIPSANLPWIPTGATQPFVVVGLDRQPFLREVTVLAVYSDWDLDIIGPNSLDEMTGPGQPEEVLGSGVVAVLMNPWPNPIQIDDRYAVVLPEGTGGASSAFIDDPATTGSNEVPFRMRVSPGVAQTIPPGGSIALVWLLSPGGSAGPPIHPPPPAAWASIVTEITDRIQAPTIFLSDSDITPTPDGATNRVPFEWLLSALPVGSERGVLLTYRGDPAWGQGANSGYEVVIDRMRPPSGDQFPSFKGTFPSLFDFQDTASGRPSEPDNRSGGFDQNWFESNFYLAYGALGTDSRWTGPPGAPDITGRVLYTTCLSRATKPKDIMGVGSISPVVVEDRASNRVTAQQDALGWLFPLGSGIGTPANVVADIVNNPASIVNENAFQNIGTDFPNRHLRGAQPAAITFADSADPYFLVDADQTNDRLPQFSLFVPNAGLIAVSDMLRLTQFAHECHDCGTTANANDLTHWRTVSEKLGLTLKNDNGENSLGNLVNRHLGILDPTRYVLGADLTAITNLPDTMAIPLALRVPDCFQALPLTGELAQGTINLNTAPEEVLKQLPMVAPRYAIPTVQYAGTMRDSYGVSVAAALTPPRVQLIKEYRDPMVGPPLLAIVLPANLPAGLRVGFKGGFATPAELAILGRWETAGTGLSGNPFGVQQDTFLELGADTNSNDHSPMQLEEYAQAGSANTEPTPHDLTKFGPYPAGSVVNPRDDAEERLALYRAVSNIVTARSDVYMAWFVIRGYDPQMIERIDMTMPPPGTLDDQVNDAMDDTNNNFAPTYESRWLVVFDRSQTESGAPLSLPTDRPRVLMKVQLPSARP